MAQYPTPVYANWGESLGSGINQGFQNIMQGMQMANQRKMSDLAFQGQTGFNPQDILGGQKVAAEFAGTELNPGNAGNVITPQQKDMWQHFQDFTSQNKQKAQAGIADTISQANQRNTTSNLNNVTARNYGGQGIPLQSLPGQEAPAAPAVPGNAAAGPDVKIDPKTGREYTMAPSKAGPQVKWLPSNAQELTPERQAAYEWARSNGVIAQNQLRSRGPATNAMLDSVIDSPEYKAAVTTGGGKAALGSISPMQSDLNFAANKAESVAPFSGTAYKVRALAQSMAPQITEASKALDAIDTGDIRVLNQIGQKLGIELGTDQGRNVVVLKQWGNAIADEMQAQLGSGSDAKLNLFRDMLASAQNPKDIKSALGIISFMSKSRAEAFSPKGQQNTATSKAAPVTKGPKAGKHDALLDKYGVP